ncbi:MAG: hypothetical protein AAGJ94_17650, partial [Pseudomonadota bacterium]
QHRRHSVSTQRQLGVTVLPEWVQAEGVEAVLDRLEAAGVNGIATSPYVMELVADGVGSREPPADAEAGGVRLLDRPLWGRRALWVRTAPSFHPDAKKYEHLVYKPPSADKLTDREGAVVGQFLDAAQARGMTTHLQVQAAIPPGYRVQFGGPQPADQPLGPEGEPVPGRVDANASLASEDILAYGEALLGDLSAQYPTVDAIRIDWPEIPPYAFGALFFDFSTHALERAQELGLDTDRMRRDTLDLKKSIAAMDTPSVTHFNANKARELLSERQGVLDLLALRRALVGALLKHYQSALPEGIALFPQAFPPPFNRLSGFDFGMAGQIVPEIGVKLYTMHWPMILRDWGEAITAMAPQLDRAAVARALVDLAGTGDPSPSDLTDLRYPEPHEPHPASDAAMAHKIRTARSEANGASITAFAHAYGPLSDVVRRVRVAWEASQGRVWINRYGYLSDEKIAALAEVTR